MYRREEDLDAQLLKARLERRRMRRKTNKLRRQIQELRLVSMAMFELLTEKTQISNEELIAKIDEIDRRDGVVDGRLREPGGPPRCPQCERVLMKSSQRCLYCDG